MTIDRPKTFGRRGAAPPVVTNAPKGLGGPAGPSARRKRTMAIALVSAGALSLGGYAAYEAFRPEKCEPGDWGETDCKQKSGHGGSGGHGGSRSSSSGMSWFHSGSSGSSSHSSFFGGFGRMGSFHFGGGS
jgi:hypothetical protein